MAVEIILKHNKKSSFPYWVYRSDIPYVQEVFMTKWGAKSYMKRLAKEIVDTAPKIVEIERIKVEVN